MWKRPECIPRKYSEKIPTREQIVKWKSCSICVPCIEVVHESGLSAGDLQKTRCTLSQLAITNSAEPDDPATRVCCGNLSVCTPLRMARHRELCAIAGSMARGRIRVAVKRVM